MAGLVGYESSDEEDEVQVQPPPARKKPLQPAPEVPAQPDDKPDGAASHPEPPAPAPSLPERPGLIGPMPQPAAASTSGFPPLEEDDDGVDEGPVLPPGSPYTATRALLRDLTLPSVPNMDIPASPGRRGGDDGGGGGDDDDDDDDDDNAAATDGLNRKFEQFLALKRDRGVHFNARIAASPALQNPALMDKLLRFAELDGAAADQYGATLAPDLWDPAAFPPSAYREQLRQSQTDVAHVQARRKGGPVEFVAAAAGGVAGGSNSRDTTPGGGGGDVPAPSTGKRKTRFDT